MLRAIDDVVLAAYNSFGAARASASIGFSSQPAICLRFGYVACQQALSISVAIQQVAIKLS
jgi:hypothetical protein